MLFRGVILIGLLAHQTRKRAIFWSALLFALFHLNPWQFPGALILGVVFARWVIQTGSLIPAIAGHALNNFLFLTVARYEIFGPIDDFNNLVFLPWWLNVCGIVLAIVGLRWFNQVAIRGGSRSKRRSSMNQSDVGKPTNALVRAIVYDRSHGTRRRAGRNASAIVVSGSAMAPVCAHALRYRS